MLNQDQVEKLKITMSTAGWREVVIPAIAARGNESIKALCLSPSERKGEAQNVQDEDLRARIREAEYVLGAFQNEVKVFDMNRARDELERQEDGANPQ